MANRVVAPNLFAPSSPNWSLAQLDQNAQNATGAINDSSLGSVNGPLADSGAVNAYSVTCSLGSPSAYNNGMTVFFNPANTNTGASTLTVSPLSSLPIVSTTGTALTGGEIVAGSTTGVVCDGSAFRIFSVSTTAITSQIWSTRLRSFQAVGNPNFEVDQVNVGNVVSGLGTTNPKLIDRWYAGSGTGTQTLRWSAQQTVGNIVVPGLNFFITSKYLHVTMTTAQTTLGANDAMFVWSTIEAVNAREIYGDVHSISILVRSSVANLKFGISMQSTTGTIYTLGKLCTLGASGTWTLIQLPALPVVAAGGTWGLSPGVAGYYLYISLAGGSGATTTLPANDTWQASTAYVPVGISNFAATNGATFDIAFVQHEPGAVCTTLMDKPFAQNYDECLRYYQKTYDYATKPGTVTNNGSLAVNALASQHPYAALSFKKTMAKVPTVVTGYSPITGAGGTVRDLVGNLDRGISSILSYGDAGFEGFGLATLNAAAALYAFHYTVDTGW